MRWHVDYGPEDHPGAWLPTPKWDDIKAVTAWVCERVDTDAVAAIEFDDRDPLELFKASEREAIAAAKNGNFNPMSDLLGEEMTAIVKLWGVDFHLGPEASALIAARLKNPRGGKRGKPKQTAEQRQLQELGNPVHAAACEVRAIEKWFRKFYSRERGQA